MIEALASLAMMWHCLAETVYFEARNQNDQGQQAVVHVVMNRVMDTRFPDEACSVARQGDAKKGYQFSWLRNNDRLMTDKNAMYRAYINTIEAWVDHKQNIDPTNGALYYHADYVKPYWRKHFIKTMQIEKHIFYRTKVDDKHTRDPEPIQRAEKVIITAVTAKRGIVNLSDTMLGWFSLKDICDSCL